MQELVLTDLIDVSLLQKIQDSFSKMTGMASLTTDQEGKPVTKGSCFTEYCMRYTRNSEKGRTLCEQCDKYGAESALKKGKSSSYVCHSGLVDFSAPIIVNDQLIGCFIGGQVLTEPPKEEYVKAVAQDLGIDYDAYWEAIQKVPVISKEQVDTAAEFLFETASVLSDISYGKYMVLEANKEIERAANMKTDFLANMSHEIRTPMNAVIGMAELSLREELTPAAREYITQIKSSGVALLNIINDILDFSKIESGKMDIQSVNYGSMSVFDEIVNIAMTRIRGKDVELLLSVNPKLPKELYGDSLRGKQVLLNLVNNAIKFTNHGRVSIQVDYEKLDEENIQLKVAVQDTGIGIKKADMDKLFQSFQQVDSKRNRNIEGTGLGLAISKRLVMLMGGTIDVQSVYGKGSTFSFCMPQKVVNWEPVIQIPNVDSMVVIGYFQNVFIAKQFFKDARKLGVFALALTASDQFEELLQRHEMDLRGKRLFLFMDEKNYDENMERILTQYPEFTGIMVTDFDSTRKSTIPNIKVLRKPLSAWHVALALTDQEIRVHSEEANMEFDFIAPKARVLLVDDNEINLTVTEGLLEPLQMQIVRADSGKMALDLIAKRQFDIIFMDHMMPELDGVETTRIIRRLHPRYDDVPIIALTANAVEGTKDMFLSEGMNDFVAKPIEVRTLVAKIRQWLPADKIEEGHVVVSSSANTEDAVMVIGNLDTSSARALIGNDQLYMEILKKYYQAIPTKSVKIKELQMKEDWENYTIEVHALKSASKQIGAMELAEMAARLEKAGNEQDITMIRVYTDEMLQCYVAYIDVLKPFCEEKSDLTPKKYIDRDSLLSLIECMYDALENLDMDEMEEVIVEMSKYDYPKEQKECFAELKVAVGNIDVDHCEEILGQWTKIM